MIALLKFLIAARRAGVAYIDVDGCLLKKFPVPEYTDPSIRLAWWKANLVPTDVVVSRIVLLYVLWFLGVSLILWTNRALSHADVTIQALGRHLELFSGAQFHDGRKGSSRLSGPVVDDDPRYVAMFPGSLLVESR